MVAEVDAEVKIIIPIFLPFGKPAVEASGNLAVNTILDFTLK